ncbi:VLRF1 family aeRF1-type release factor [Alkalihalobacillus deserti]|uniref:VLRF1 family aeRF1-type release factor n=1 Tax=Alkalihalobacillus deserti TaxID=2879466 RepID=UPI001D1550E0|nr:VLRF1 family aeRF1-type release factor [Alkalihalobacillus deserti]
MAILKELQQLKDQYCEEGVLTIYLNTDQTSNDQQKGEWKIRLKNGLKKLEEYIESSDRKHLSTYKKIKRKAKAEIVKLQLELPKSLVLIATANGDLFIKKLKLRVNNQFHWEKKPVISQLEQIQSDYPQEGILFIQKEDVFIIETSLGEVNNEISYELDLENEDWKQYEGVGARERMASSANHRDKYDQRVEAIQQRWYKHIASELDKKAKEKGWQHIYLVGEQELISEFVKHLKFINIKIINKNYTKFTSKEIVDQVLAS